MIRSTYCTCPAALLGLLLLVFPLLLSGQATVPVQATGALRSVMREGQLQGKIDLDTLSERAGLVGVGPLEGLKGEVMLLDGQCWVARVQPDGQLTVQPSWQARAPFFVHARVTRWEEMPLPEHIRDLAQLESFLDHLADGEDQPFPFRLQGRVQSALIHVLNVPDGLSVRSPEQVQPHKVFYRLEEREADLAGFFSRHHPGVFTHHDAYTHIHLLTTDRKWMGHLDEVSFQPGTMRLLLPAR